MTPAARHTALVILAAVNPANLAQAHEGTAATSWTFDAWITLPLLISLAWFLLGYAHVAARSSRPGAHRPQLLWFLAGWSVLAGALVTPLHAAGEQSFTAHMLEHELLMLVAAPLLVLSRPLGIALWALPHASRLWLAALGNSRSVSGAWRAMTAPLPATLAQAAVLWLWHAPVAFDLALASTGWHVVQHLCFLVSALLFWWAMLHGRGHHVGLSVGCLFFTSVVSGALGALMAFSSGPWYRGYAALGLDAFGLSPAEDQQLAGLLMWIPGGLVHAAVGIALLARGLRLDTARTNLSTMCFVLAWATAAWALTPARAAAHTDAVRELRICADPNNLPFSNQAGAGFENRIGDLLAQDLHAKVTYTWWAQRRGALRNTLNAHTCDIVPGIVTGMDGLATTRPYYTASYMFVARANGRWQGITSFDDPRLREARIGVQLVGDDGANTPPAHVLARRGILANVRGFMVYGDYAQPAPQADIVAAVADGRIDVAVVWGPTAGYYAARSSTPLQLTPVSPAPADEAWPMAFAVSMGVRRDDQQLLRTLDDALTRNAAAIRSVLADYDVPLVQATVSTGGS